MINLEVAGGSDRSYSRLTADRRFTPTQTRLARDYARQVAVVITVATRPADSADAGSSAVGEDRDRIARHLHDRVIQRLFAVGLDLNGLAVWIHNPEGRDRLDRLVADIDEAIYDIRSTIFDLEHRGPGVRLSGQILDVIRELTPQVGIDPEVRIEGPVDAVDSEVVPEVLAMLREALAYAGQHARASKLTVLVRAGSGNAVLTIAVEDNGVGLSDTARHRDLASMRDHTERFGGQLVITGDPSGGTFLRWSVSFSRQPREDHRTAYHRIRSRWPRPSRATEATGHTRSPTAAEVTGCRFTVGRTGRGDRAAALALGVLAAALPDARRRPPGCRLLGRHLLGRSA